MLIDKDGKVFGKINIIDLLVLVILIILLSVFGTKFLLPKTGEEKLVLSFSSEETENWMAERLGAGDTLYDSERQTSLGVVTEVQTAPPRRWGVTDAGEFLLSSREGFSAVIVQGEVYGMKTESGAEIGGNLYAIGQPVTLHVGDVRLLMRVKDIRE